MMIRTSEAVQSDATTWPLGHFGMYLQQSIGQSIYSRYGKGLAHSESNLLTISRYIILYTVPSPPCINQYLP